MIAFHGTSALFPLKELTGGPDTAAKWGKPMPGLWLTTSAELAANYASWDADCLHKKKPLLRVISVEVNDECPRIYAPGEKESFVVSLPNREKEMGRLKVLRGYKIIREPLWHDGRMVWMLKNPEIDVKIIVLTSAQMEASPDIPTTLLPPPENA